MTTEKTFPFAVFWVSPRGFANEGDWIYGTTEELRKAIAESEPKNYHRESWHKTIDAARCNAINLARRDRRASPSHEICAIGAACVDGSGAEKDGDIVRYGWDAAA